MVRLRSGPTLKKLMIMTAVLVVTVLVLRKMSSVPLDLMKQSHNKAFYEQMYSEVNDEVAYWRQRYDQEFARAEDNLKSLTKLQDLTKQLQEENEALKTDVAKLQQVKDQ